MNRARDREAYNAYQKAWYATHKEQARKTRLGWRTKNADVAAARPKAWREANAERYRECLRNWSRENAARKNALNAAYKASVVNACPQWLTKEHKQKIRKTYAYAKAFGCHVDHIVPLKGKMVCGLHVPWNLQILDPHSNISKGNRHV